MVAIESKDWRDHKGHRKTKAGFAKVLVAKETKENAQNFVDKVIEKNAMVNTDASPSLIHLENVDVDYQVVGSNEEILDHWLPWVHKFIYGRLRKSIIFFKSFFKHCVGECC